MDAGIILNVIVLIAIIIVGFILGNQIKSQKEKINTLEKYSNLLNDYVKIFDLDTVKKYVSNQEEIMKQDLELLRRKTIKETTQTVSKDFVESAMNAFPKEFSKVLEELVKFVAYTIDFRKLNNKEKEEYLIKMFPNSHSAISAYLNQFNVEK